MTATTMATPDYRAALVKTADYLAGLSEKLATPDDLNEADQLEFEIRALLDAAPATEAVGVADEAIDAIWWKCMEAPDVYLGLGRSGFRLAARELLSRFAHPAPVPVGERLPEWVVNNLGELGVKIGDRFFFLYKGRSLEYKQEDAQGMHWRPVGKREFGESCHPINWKDPTQIGTVSLSDSDEWRALPLPEEKESAPPG